MTQATDPALGAPLAGRADELAHLTAALEAAESGTGRIVLVSGEAGVGKSRMLREIAAVVRNRGARAAFGAAYEGADGRPFGPIIDLLRATPGGARAVPALSETGVEASASRWAQIDAVVDALAGAISAQPALRLVALEDLHWADASTIELLTQVLRRVEALPLLVVGTFRPPRADTPALVTFADSVRQLFNSERIDLGPIPAEAATELVRAALGDRAKDADVAAIVQRGDGNPLFLEEAARDAARAAREGGAAPAVPVAIRELVQRRANSLPPEARDAAAAIAVFGDAAHVATVSALLDVAPADASAAIDRLIAEAILARQPDGTLAFRHALIRDGVYAWASATQRHDLHERSAQFIERTEGDRGAARIAYHLAQAGGNDNERRAGAFLARAGTLSLAQLAYEQAAEQLRDAVRIMERAGEDAAVLRQVRLHLAQADSLTRADDEVLDGFAAIADDASSADDVEVEATAAVEYERTFAATGRPRSGADARSVPLLDRALAHLEARGPMDQHLARVLASAAQARFFAGQSDEALAFAARAIAAAQSSGDAAAEAAALDTRRLATWGPDAPADRLALTRAIIERATAAGDLDLRLEGLYWQAAVLLETGARGDVDTAVARFGALAGRLRQPRRLSELHRMRAMLAHLGGDLDTARTESAEALRLAESAGNYEARFYFIAQTAVIASEAERRAAILEVTNNMSLWTGSLSRRLMVAYLSMRAGERERAVRVASGVMADGLDDLPRDHMWLPMMSLLAEVVADIGEPVWAQRVYEQLAPYADRYVVNSNAVCYGSVERLLGRLASVTGAPDAEAHRRRGVEQNEAIDARVWIEALETTSTRVTKTFMFTDIVKSTNLAEALGDDAWELLLRWHNQALEEQFRAFGGVEVVSTGDGFFVAFDTPDAAIDCAVAIQRALDGHRRTTGFAPQVRIGVHATEATEVDRNYHGVGVHEAARISALAEGGEILASTSTAGRRATLGLPRTVALKGIAEPVEIVALAWR